MSRTEYVFMLPDLGEGLASGDLTEIHIKIGEEVVADQLALVVDTTKASVELPMPFAGKVVEIHGEIGDTIPVGAPLLTLLTDEAPAQDTTQVQHLVGQSSKPADTGLTRRLPPRKPAQRIAASPIVRRLARELGVELIRVTGTGKAGAITADDVRAAKEAAE